MMESQAEQRISRLARQEVFRTIGRALWRFRRRTLVALAFLISAKLLAVLVPVALKYIVDALNGAPAVVSLPVFLLIGYAVLRLLSGVFTELRDLAFVRVMQTTIADFTLRMFTHLHSLGVPFHVSRETGALARDLQRGTAGLGFLLSALLFTILPTVIEIAAVVIILMAGFRAGFALIVFVTFIAYGYFTVYFTERRIYFQRRLNDVDSQAGGQLVDSLLNYETVKLYNAGGTERRRLGAILDRWIDLGLGNQRALSTLHIGQSAIIAAGVASVMLLAGRDVVTGRMTVGDLVLVNAYIIQISLPLNALGAIFRQTREALVNAESIAALLARAGEGDAKGGLPALELSRGEVVFDRVDFSYEPGRPILRDLSFTIAPGQTLAVVGGSGSGKSTLARLLLRFYDVEAGAILLDGQNLTSVTPASVRAEIGIVPQETTLFNSTIAHNIAYGRPDATEEEIVAAAKAAAIHEFILSLPAQYETVVGERGVRLSGGERQRIAIARVLLKNPPVLILDEATSALDTRTERAIQEKLDDIARGRTTMIIAHRLSTVVDADQILVMEQGRIVERGTHDELLRANQLYAHMWNLQRQQSRLQEEGARLTMQPVNLMVMMANVLDAIRPLIQEKGIIIYTLASDENIRVTADPSVLQRLLWELCVNAIVVTPPGGRMELRVERSGPLAGVTVRDGRLPVEEEEAEAEEEPVWSSSALHVPPDPSRMGALLKEMGGNLHIQQATGDSGMAYRLELPLRAVAELSAAGSMDGLPTSTLSGLRLYLADDQSEARELLADVLRDHGALVTSFETGAHVLAALEGTPADQWPAALLCDISLGDIDGYAVMERVRSLEAERGIPLSRRLPAIALSGYAGGEVRLRALLAGFQIYLSKPVDTRELVATVSAVTRRPIRSGSGA